MSPYMKSTITLLGLAAVANASGYARFCETIKDGQAQGNCGIAVSTQNNGCLKESGRHSLGFTESDGGLYFPLLIAFHDDNCQHEKGCNALGQTGTELDISFDDQEYKFAEGALSYKFIHGSPGHCPNGCVGECADAKKSRVMRARDEEVIELVKQEGAAANETNELETRQIGDNYWFCDDENCSQNCGNHIETLGKGCASLEYGRKSVFMKGLQKHNYKSAKLGGYDNNECTGTPVVEFEVPNGCHKLPSQHEGWNVVGLQD